MDYYTVFCVPIMDITEQERLWLTGLSQHVDENDPDMKTAEHREAFPDGMPDDYWPDFNLQFQGANAYIESEESGNIDNAAAAMQAFLRKFRFRNHIVFGWASYPSRPVPDGYGGGHVYVDRHNILFSGEGFEDKYLPLVRILLEAERPTAVPEPVVAIPPRKVKDGRLLRSKRHLVE
jgi:hypothetical protein